MEHEINVKWEGVTPLMMHNSSLADPLNEYALEIKSITSKHASKKTDTDQLVLRKLEWSGGLYFDDEIGPHIPVELILATIREGGKKNRKGSDVVSGVIVLDDIIPLEYNGPRTRQDLYEDKNFVDSRVVTVNNGKAKIIRTRPRFNRWAVNFNILVDDEIIGVDDVKTAMVKIGRLGGLGDARKIRFGKFMVSKFEVSKTEQ